MSTNIFGIFDTEEFKSMAILIDRLEKSPFDYLKLENGDTKIVISKGEVSDVGESSTKAVASVSSSTEAVAVEPQETTEKVETAAIEEASATVTKKKLWNGRVAIKGSFVWALYAQAALGNPYVEVGSKVKQGDTVGLYEVMKVFSSIAAPADGEVIEIMSKCRTN